MSESHVTAFKSACIRSGIDPSWQVLAHGSYLINLANPALEVKAFAGFLDELQRCETLGIGRYNFQ